MDDATLTRLFDEHGARLFRRLLVLVGRREDAEDALQNVFVKLASVAPPANARAYLDRATRNEGFELLRRRKRPMPPPRPELVPRDGASFEEAEAISAALSALPHEQAQVVLLRIYEEMTFAEIGELLGVPQDTAASRYRYAIEKLRRERSTEARR